MEWGSEDEGQELLSGVSSGASPTLGREVAGRVTKRMRDRVRRDNRLELDPVLESESESSEGRLAGRNGVIGLE